MTSTAAAGAGYRLRVEAPDTLAVSLVMSPQQSVISLLHQAASGHSLRPPTGLVAAIGKALRPQARFALQSFAGSFASVPEFCVPISPLADTSVTEQARRLRDLPVETLTGELAADVDHRFPPGWQCAGQQPRRWLNSMADASLDTWTVMEPWWRAAGPLFDREMRRVGTAAVRGGLGALLNSLHPLLSYRDGTLTLACGDDRCVPLGGRRLVLVPLIAGRDSVLVSFDRDDVCYVCYPVRQPGPDLQATGGSALATILGPLRAAILRALRQPLTVSDVAVAVHCAPTTATYHLHQLAAAGLISREKSGPSVRVSRTARGSELVDLLSD